MLFTKKGQAIRFAETKIRHMGRQAQGIRGMRLRSGDEIIGCDIVAKGGTDQAVLVASAVGFGKKTKASEFKTQSRGGSGVKTMNVSDKTGTLVAARVIDVTSEEFIAISEKGKTLRTFVKEIPTLKRATQGVRIMKLEPHDRLRQVAIL